MKPAKPDLQETLAIAEYSIRVGLGVLYWGLNNYLY